jgi:hypothetical protein
MQALNNCPLETKAFRLGTNSNCSEVLCLMDTRDCQKRAIINLLLPDWLDHVSKGPSDVHRLDRARIPFPRMITAIDNVLKGNRCLL